GARAAARRGERPRHAGGDEDQARPARRESGELVRRLIAVAALAACASAGAPPGGPERKEPPAIVSITPDSGATAPRTRSVLFTFDEVVSDRPGGGKTDLNQLFLISPSDGTPRVNWHRSSIEVRPRNGFQRDRAYAVTLLPGLTDLRGNMLR